MNKTNAMRQLDKAKISYQTLNYEIDAKDFSGEKVANLLNLDPLETYKTLALFHEHDLYIMVIPIAKELDLKKAASEIGVKKLEMVHVKDLLKKVGYERGSVSPVGIIAKHKTYFDIEVNNHQQIEISGGKMGIGLVADKDILLKYLNAEVKDLCQ